MKIKKVEIEAFRAYKYKAEGTFDFTTDGENPCGFVSIYAPNGFGKSSFYDAVEWALTNNVHRYINEANKRSNEAAAKGTKQDGIPQYILRNRDIEGSIETSVLVSTTEKDFVRKLPTVRKDSRDIRFTDTDTEDGTQSYRNIILSQDSIDRFVREVKPEERYNLFMEHFGGNAEEVRKNLHVILHENNNSLAGLIKSRDEVLVEIDNDVDDSVLSEYNKTIDVVLSLGEEAHPISIDLTSVQEHETISSILKRKHQLGNEIKNNEVTLATLESQLNKAGEIEALLLRKSQIEPEIARLNKGLEGSKHYQELTEAYLKKVDERSLCTLNLRAINELKEKHPSFQALDNSIKNKNLHSQSLQSIKVDLESKLESAGQKATEIDSTIGNKQEKLRQLCDLDLRAGNLYIEISNTRQLLSRIDDQLEASRATIKISDASKKTLGLELSRLSSIELTIEGILSSDISPINLEDSTTLELTDLRQKLASLDNEIEKLRTVQKALTEQSSTIERLVALGLEHVSIHQTKDCPLCQHEHPSELALKSAIIENKYATEILQNNSEMMRLSLLLKDEVEQRIQKILVDFSNDRDIYIEKTQQSVLQLEEKINLLEAEYLSLDAQRLNALDKIALRSSAVFGLESSDLGTHISNEKKEIEISLAQLNQEKIRVRGELEYLVKKLSESNGHISILMAQILSIEKTPLFTEFRNYINSKGSRTENISDVIDQDLAAYSESLQDLTIEINDLIARQDAVKSAMVTAGIWLDFEFLKSRHLTESNELTKIENYIFPYFRSIAELVGNSDPASHPKFRVLIEDTLGYYRIKVEDLKYRLSIFELLEIQLNALVPYFHNVKRREDLGALEVEIEKYSNLALTLNAELSKVTLCLQDQIKSYFYTDFINDIYKKIDPHPEFKRVDFTPKFSVGERPQLNIIISDENGNVASPNLYFSAAQLNILSLSVFLARAIHANHDNKPLDVIMIDDPIHSMDSINILSMIDMLRNISVQFNKQIIISTHDENFFQLLKKKVPSDIFDSKFITLKSYGVVSQHLGQGDKISNSYS